MPNLYRVTFIINHNDKDNEVQEYYSVADSFGMAIQAVYDQANVDPDPDEVQAELLEESIAISTTGSIRERLTKEYANGKDNRVLQTSKPTQLKEAWKYPDK